jgi:hypothetical protein
VWLQVLNFDIVKATALISRSAYVLMLGFHQSTQVSSTGNHWSFIIVFLLGSYLSMSHDYNIVNREVFYQNTTTSYDLVGTSANM